MACRGAAGQALSHQPGLATASAGRGLNPHHRVLRAPPERTSRVSHSPDQVPNLSHTQIMFSQPLTFAISFTSSLYAYSTTATWAKPALLGAI